MITITTSIILIITLTILFFQIYFISIGVGLNDFKKLLIELNFKPIKVMQF